MGEKTRGRESSPDMEIEREARPIVVRNTTDLQRLKLEKLMKNPDKPILIPERPKERGVPVVPDFVRNVMGSSAGAGSGEFHVYRHLRRKEYARQKYMKEKGERERLDNEYHDKLEENKKKAQERTAKKRQKRLKRKQKQKGQKKLRTSSRSSQSDETDSSSEGDTDKDRDDENDEMTDNPNNDVENDVKKVTMSSEERAQAHLAKNEKDKSDCNDLIVEGEKDLTEETDTKSDSDDQVKEVNSPETKDTVLKEMKEDDDNAPKKETEESNN